MASLPDPPEMRLPRLDKSNFRWWQASLRAALKAHSALDALSAEPPTGQAERERFDRMDGLAAFLILGSVPASDHPRLPECATAKQMFEMLEKRYRRQSGASGLLLHLRLTNLRMREGDSVSAHLNQILSISSDIKAMGERLSDEAIIALILISLPRSFAGEVAFLNSRSDLTLEFVCSYLEEEGERREMSQLEEGLSGLRVEPGFQKGNRKKDVRCFSCAKLGHVSRDCRVKREEDGTDHTAPAPTERGSPTRVPTGKGVPRGRGRGNAGYKLTATSF